MDREIHEQVEAKLRLLARQFDMVLRTTRDPDQRKRVSSQYAGVKKSLDALEKGEMSDEEAGRFLRGQKIATHEQAASDYDERGEGGGGEFTILSTIPISDIGGEYGGPELNAIHSYLQHFETEYLPTLGQHQLKLDFSYAQRRDAFFHTFSTLQLTLKGHIADITDPSYDRLVQSDQSGRVRQTRRRMQLDLVMKCGEFVSGLRGFLWTLLNDHKTGGNLILNPEDTITFDPIHGERELNGKLVVESVERVCLFLNEFAEYLNVPGY